MYKSKLSLLETEIAIKYVKDTFEKLLANKLNLIRVSAPLFVFKETGLNDDLSGKEVPISFMVNGKQVEIVHSLAKWKRNALLRYGFKMHDGLYTDMNAIRKDEVLDNVHSLYVDQWDWEKIISKDERNFTTLKNTVQDIYEVLLQVEEIVNQKYPTFEKKLPENITFISTTELLNLYPNLTNKQREKEICKKYKAVFLYQIGWPLQDGNAHDLRAADYDDWNLNGDILVYDKVIDDALELSSMGIRVDKESLIKQLHFKKEEYKLSSPYSNDIIEERLPYTVGGGIGQSRICMFYLEKKHIGEVQCSIWDNKDKDVELL